MSNKYYDGVICDKIEFEITKRQSCDEFDISYGPRIILEPQIDQSLKSKTGKERMAYLKMSVKNIRYRKIIDK
jgi:hypothetical protein